MAMKVVRAIAYSQGHKQTLTRPRLAAVPDIRAPAMYLRSRDKLPLSRAEPATRDYSRLSCGIGTRLGPRARIAQPSLIPNP